MQNFVYVIIVGFFWIGAVRHGYLYELDYLFANLFLFTTLIISILIMKQIRLHLIHLLLFLIILIYWISCSYAVDIERAIYEAVKVTTLLPFTLLVAMLTKDRIMKVFRWFPYISTFVVIIGVVFQMERQGRLESTLEYANALAILLLISLLTNIFLYINKGYRMDLILLIIQATGLMLTFSRSVWVLWALSLLVLLMFKELRSKGLWLKIFGVHLISFFITAMLKKDVLFFWSRLKSIQPETSELRIRLVYWKDSLTMIVDHLWWGTGGGGWSVLLPSYRSEEYFVRYVHNHYLQMALDIGIFGFLFFVLILVLFYSRGINLIKAVKSDETKNNVIWTKGLLLTVTMLLLHGGFDFDFSFLILFALFMIFVEYVMKDSLKLGTVQIQPNKSVKIVVIITIVMIITSTGWLMVGRTLQTNGQNKVLQGELEGALRDYSLAIKMMPWAASLHYEMAKTYVLLGNKMNDRHFYTLGKSQIEKAVRLVPNEELYRSLYLDLAKSLE